MNYPIPTRRAVLAVCLAVVLGVIDARVSAEPVSMFQTDAAAIEELVRKYARSVDAADAQLAAAVWAMTADVSFIHPRGHEHGWDMIKTNVYEKTMRDLFSERKLDVRDIVVHVYGDAAWAEFYWAFEAKLRSDGSKVTTRGRETQVFRRRDGRWFLVHVHYSAMPATG